MFNETGLINETSNRFDVIPYKDLSPESTWERLGKGSFGCVFKGEYLGLEVAIKEVLYSTEYDVEKYFKRECKIMQEARHPNVVQYLALCLAPPAPLDRTLEDLSPPTTSSFGPTTDSSHSDDTYAKPPAYTPPPSNQSRILIISEFLPGGNLRSYILNKKLKFSWRLRLSFAIDITRALTYMHLRNCMHRDLKGENLLITENDRIKVCDFGFARIAARTNEELKRLSYCGTDGYMSPEILMGLEFGLPTDIFSLGIIFCEILCRTLVDSDTLVRYPPTFGIDPSELRSLASSDCPETFLTLALRCCAIDPLYRPTALEVLRELRKIENNIILNEVRVATVKGLPPTLDFTTHIGSMKFSETIRGGGPKRPSMGQRLPSWEGQVRVTRSRQNSSDSDTSNGSESGSSEGDGNSTIGTLIEALAKVEVGGGAQMLTDEILYTPAIKRNEHVARVASPIQESQETKSGSNYSTRVIRSSHLLKNLESHTESTITIKPPKVRSGKISGPNDRTSSIPSIPSAWLPSKDFTTSPSAEASSSGSELSEPSTPELEDLPPPSKVGTIATFFTARTTTLSIANATVRGGNDENEVSGDIFIDARPPSPRTVLATMLHRFSLVKPGWTRLFVAYSNLSVTGNANHSHEQNKCGCCEKKLGMMKTFLECDDCGFRAHPKCADMAPANCNLGLPFPDPLSPSPITATQSNRPLSHFSLYSQNHGPAKLKKKSK